MSNNNEPLKDQYKRLVKYFIIAFIVAAVFKFLTAFVLYSLPL